MSEPVYFVVERVHGRLCPALIYDRLPRKGGPQVYSKRVDDQPHLAGRMLFDLFDEYNREGGKLSDAPRPIQCPTVFLSPRHDHPAVAEQEHREAQAITREAIGPSPIWPTKR